MHRPADHTVIDRMSAIKRRVLKNIRLRDELGKFAPDELAKRYKVRMEKRRLDQSCVNDQPDVQRMVRASSGITTVVQ